jgi:hypothetical protein
MAKKQKFSPNFLTLNFFRVRGDDGSYPNGPRLSHARGPTPLFSHINLLLCNGFPKEILSKN